MCYVSMLASCLYSLVVRSIAHLIECKHLTGHLPSVIQSNPHSVIDLDFPVSESQETTRVCFLDMIDRGHRKGSPMTYEVLLLILLAEKIHD